MKDIFIILSDIVTYIFNLRITDIPLHLFYVGISAGLGYCAAMIIIGFPCSVFEAVTKKKIQEEEQDKIIKVIAIGLFVFFLLSLLYELATK